MLKETITNSTENFETYNGANISSWRNFNWKSKHTSVSIIIPSEFILNSSSESKGSIVADSRIHTITHVFINAAKIITKS